MAIICYSALLLGSPDVLSFSEFSICEFTIYVDVVSANMCPFPFCNYCSLLSFLKLSLCVKGVDAQGRGDLDYEARSLGCLWRGVDPLSDQL
jgi:hypothetical protein